MGDDYRVIARSVRRPMQRWWERVGVWWVALIVLLLAVKAIVIVLDRHYTQILPSGGLYKPMPDYFRWLELTSCVISPLYVMLWLLAAFRVVDALDDLTRGSSVVDADSRFLVFRFRLVLAQVYWPIALAIVHAVAVWIGHFSYSAGAEWWRPNGILESITNIGSVFWLLIQLLWLGALLVHRSLPRSLIWLWWFGVVGGSFASLVFNLTQRLGFGRPPLLSIQQVELISGDLVRLAAFLALAATVCLLAARQRIGVAFVYILGVIGVLSALRIGLQDIDPQPESTALCQAYYTLACINCARPLSPLVWMQYYVLPDSQLLTIDGALFHFRINLSLWLFWIALPIQALIAYGYYWLIRWLLVMGALRHKASGASPRRQRNPQSPSNNIPAV